MRRRAGELEVFYLMTPWGTEFKIELDPVTPGHSILFIRMKGGRNWSPSEPRKLHKNLQRVTTSIQEAYQSLKARHKKGDD